MDFLLRTETWAALFSLVALEIVLGIDNIVFISLICSKFPKDQQSRARTLGLSLAMLSRIGLLCSLAWVMSLGKPLFSLLNHGVTGKDLLFICGGIFLLVKAVQEIHAQIEGDETERRIRKTPSLLPALLQIMVLDVVFSLDSVVTAVGMTNELVIMILAVVLAVAVMIQFSEAISRFIDERPSVKMLAFSFLLLIGFVLIAEGFGHAIPKGYIYPAIGFSLAVELLNSRRLGKKRKAGTVRPDEIIVRQNHKRTERSLVHVLTNGGASCFDDTGAPLNIISSHVCIQRLGAIDYEFFQPGG